MKPAWHILPVIVLSQFCGTSLWFAGNGVMEDLVLNFALHKGALGHLTSAVQLGFISGTLLFAFLTIADRFSPSKVFLVSAAIAAAINFGMIWEGNTMASLLVLRYLTGFFLAGIYPVGMKIAADYYDKGLGKSLGFLVGALVVGTAFPHLLKGMSGALPWKSVLISVSVLALAGGLLIACTVPDGPFRQASQRLDLAAFFRVFRKPAFRAAAFGYFGHMWELYAFWTFVPVILATHTDIHASGISISEFSFVIIGIGGLSCILGGYLSLNIGPKKTAFYALLLSGLCCLASPLMFSIESQWLFVGFLMLWGMVVIADSPMFSTLVAQNADPTVKGTALTIVNCIGFAITIFSIQLLTVISATVPPEFLYVVLAAGPILGLLALSSSAKS